MARNIKDSFVDGLLQIAILLSLLRTNWRELNTTRVSSDQFCPRDSNWGQLEVSPLINTYNNDRWNPIFGVSVHPKHVENDRVEEVLRRVHRLADYRGFDGLSTRIDAFLLEEGSEASLPGVHSSLRVDSVSNQASNFNPCIIGEEPSKDDMDLIDVLWRQDIDLGGVEDVGLMRELEKSEEMRLHNKQEEETIEQLIHSFNFSQHTNHSFPASDIPLNNTDLQLNPLFPDFQVFSSFFESQSLLHRRNIVTTSSSSRPPLFPPPIPLSTNRISTSNPTSTNHTQGPDGSRTMTLDSSGGGAFVGNLSVEQLEESVNLMANNNTATASIQDFLEAFDSFNDYNGRQGGHEGDDDDDGEGGQNGLDCLINGIITDVSLNTRQENLPSITYTQSDAAPIQHTPHCNNSNNNNNNNNNEVVVDAAVLMSDDNFNEQFGSLEDLLGMEDFTNQQQQLEEAPASSLSTPTFPPLSPLFPLHDTKTLEECNVGNLSNNNKNNNIGGDDGDLFNDNLTSFLDSTLSEDFLLTEIADESEFMELLSATDNFNMGMDVGDVNSASFSFLPEDRGGMKGDANHPPFSHSTPPYNAHTAHSYDTLYPASNSSSSHFSSSYHTASPSSSHHQALSDDVPMHQSDERIKAFTTHNHTYAFPGHITCIKPDPDALPSCSRPHSFSSHTSPSLPPLPPPTYEADFKPSVFPFRKSTRKTSYKTETGNGEDDDDDEMINPGGIDDNDDDDDDDDDYNVEDDYFYNSKSKMTDHDFKNPPKNKKSFSAASMSTSASLSRNKDELKAFKMAIPFAVDEIINCQAERFNEMVTSRDLTPEQVQLLKDIRKRGKNKLAAQNCRKRKMDVISALEEELEALREQRQAEVDRKSKALSSLEEVKRKVALVQDQILSSLRETQGGTRVEGEETDLAIEQTVSGAVFILPRDKSTEQGKMRRKRK